MIASFAVLVLFASPPEDSDAQPTQESISEESEVLTLADVEFPHLLHVEEFDAECDACHHETNARKLTIPHSDYFEDFWIKCGTCHHDDSFRQKPQACSKCHHNSTTNTADQTLSAKVVIHQSCWSCHDSGKGIEASQSCTTCHSDPGFDLAKPRLGRRSRKEAEDKEVQP